MSDGRRELGPLVPELFAIIGGMLMAFIVALPLNTLIGRGVAPELVAPVVAPLIEEPTKVLGIVFLVILYPAAIATKTRGMVLGAMSGLGFGFLESVFYVLQGADPFIRVWTIFSHMIWSSIVGIGLAYVATKDFDRSSFSIGLGGFFGRALSAGFLVFLVTSMLFHGLHNAAGTFIWGDASLVVVIIMDLIALFVLFRYRATLPENLKGVDVVSVALGKFAMRPTPSGPAPSESSPPAAPVKGSKFCPYCGVSVSQSAGFCNSCGRKLR